MEDLACYRELWIKPAENIQDSYLYEFIFEACRFFSNKGYICDPSEIYSVLGRMGEVDIKRLLYTMTVHSSDQSEEFDSLYGEFVSFFFQKEKEMTAAREAADKARRDSEKATKEYEKEVAAYRKRSGI